MAQLIKFRVECKSNYNDFSDLKSAADYIEALERLGYQASLWSVTYGLYATTQILVYKTSDQKVDREPEAEKEKNKRN